MINLDVNLYSIVYFIKVGDIVLTNENIEQLIIARYYYSYGVDYMSDTLYEEYMNVLRQENPTHWLVTTHWSMDPTPVLLLQKYNLPFIENRLSSIIEEEELPDEILKLREEYNSSKDNLLKDIPQKSIELIQDYETIYERCESFGHVTFHASIKADGQNFTAVYYKGHLISGRTKGRTGNPLDITKVLRLILPVHLEIPDEVLVISGELVCYKQSLPYLRSKYTQAFKSTRSAVSTLLRGGLSKEDINSHLKPLVFKVRSESLNTLRDEFIWAKQHGFNTPEWLVFNYNSWDDIINLFNHFTPYKELLPYSSDGIVLAINDNHLFYSQGETDHHYLGNLALKVGVWNPGYYVGIVKAIKWSEGETVWTPEAVIEPVRVKHGSDVTSIPVDHVARMVEHNILPGSEIYFKITGDSKITLVHREEELKNMVIENQ